MERITACRALKNLNLLYVEDEDGIREVFKKMLERYVKNIYTASNAQEAISIFKTNNIDLVISDIKMPEMNGIELSSIIKEINQDIPIILITAFNEEKYLNKAIDLGVDSYLIKPIDRNKLFSKLNFLAESIASKKDLESYIKLTQILFNNQTIGLLLLDKDFNVKMYNIAFMEIYEKVSKSPFNNIEDLKLYCKDEVNDIIEKKLLLELANQKKRTVVKINPNDDVAFYELEVKEVDDYLLISLKDITNYKLEVENIREDLFIDSLTKAYNRKKFEKLKRNLINTKVCIVMADIDNFKNINDTYGHSKGDEVLKILVETLKNNLRESDTIIRWGGEEFLIIFHGTSKIEIGKKIAEGIRKAIENIEIYGVGKITCSFGVSCKYISNENDIDELIKLADKALYVAKNSGKNRVEVLNK